MSLWLMRVTRMTIAMRSYEIMMLAFREVVQYMLVPRNTISGLKLQAKNKRNHEESMQTFKLFH